MNLPAEIYSVASVRAIDQVAINDAGIGGYTLMTRAAEAALAEAQARFPDARRWQVICGGGNNGGDGYVLARLAAASGIGVSVLALAPADSLQGDAATAFHHSTPRLSYWLMQYWVAAWNVTLKAVSPRSSMPLTGILHPFSRSIYHPD